MNNVTTILSAIERGDSNAAEALLPLVYDELRKLAAHRLSHEDPGQTLQPTALVHEAYLRLLGESPEPCWESRGHFFAAAAQAMRRILVERARRRRRSKHGGGRSRVDLDTADTVEDAPGEDLVALDAALDKLALEDPLKAKLVNLRFFAGLTMPEIAQVMDISLATAERRWAYARAWLYIELNDQDDSASS